MTRLLCLSVIPLLMIGSTTGVFGAQKEDAVKCAFVYNFAKFVKWPDNAFAGPSAPINVGFVGSGTTISTAFGETVKGRNAGGRDLVVKPLTGATGAEECQIVYIVDESLVGPVTKALKGKPILIVGDAETLLEAGGTIRFFTDSGKIAFEINLAAAKASDLQLDPRLVNLAKRTKGG